VEVNQGHITSIFRVEQESSMNQAANRLNHGLRFDPEDESSMSFPDVS
jgi:hypothetical protein